MSDDLVRDARVKMKNCLAGLERELTSVRAGKANASLLDTIRVDYYGSLVPLQQVASINVPEARLIVVQPWEKPMVAAISKAIQSADLGLNPTDDGNVVRIPIPALTEERRMEFVKKVKQIGEGTKVSIRQVRRDANEQLKKLEAAKEISEDDLHRLNADVQKATDDFVKSVEETLKQKEHDILEI